MFARDRAAPVTGGAGPPSVSDSASSTANEIDHAHKWGLAALAIDAARHEARTEA